MDNFNNLPLETMSQLSHLYSQAHRHYHNLNHINRCLSIAEELSEHSLSYRQKTELITAIWFHDAVYNPWSKNNEVLSAELARLYCHRANINHNSIVAAIKATEYHTKDQKFHRDDSIDIDVIHYMLDIDLVGLADPYTKYSEAGEYIRKEYSHLNNDEFYNGRHSFLTNMIKRKRIFYHDSFYESYEYKARENMKLELNQLYGKLT